MKALLAIAAVGLGLIGALSSVSSQPYYGYRDYRVFNERSYLRCNPDVRRAVYRGEFRSGYEHYVKFGRREGRRIWC